MQRKVLSLAMVGLSLILLPGCNRKKPMTAPEALVQAAAVPAPDPAPAAPPAPPAPPEPADPLDGDLASVNEYVRSQGLLDDVFYEYDSSSLTDSARQRLAANAQFFNRHTAFEAVIEGHCDERGTPEYNLALGERRASSAREYLASLGVDGSRLRTITYGEERPACSENEEGCWSRNRRSHFLITGRRATD
jgi:peptidoglycan-associated lipoprotein